MGIIDKNLEGCHVGLLELFYDFIFVSAILEVAAVVSQGYLSNPNICIYHFLVCLSIFQVWLYMTIYINRYGKSRWYEMLFMGIHGVAALYMSNTASADWSRSLPSHSTMMTLMLGSIVALYFIKSIESGIDKEEKTLAQHIALSIVWAFMLQLFVTLSFGRIPFAWSLILAYVAVLGGVIFPAFSKTSNTWGTVINFSHLVERFELITLIAFGEATVFIGEFFVLGEFILGPPLIFILFVSMFVWYVIQIHVLCEHHRHARALVLMYTHFAAIIALSLLIGTLSLVYEDRCTSIQFFDVVCGTQVIFYGAMLLNCRYYREGVKLSCGDCTGMAVSFFLGIYIYLLTGRTHLSVLMGAIITALGCLAVFIHKLQSNHVILED